MNTKCDSGGEVAQPGDSSCCSGGHAAGPLQAFGAYAQAVSAAGKLDARTKELIIFGLTVMARCEACVSHHHAQAVRMGISQAELDEAAWCAALIGGAPVRMFYMGAMKNLAKNAGGRG